MAKADQEFIDEGEEGTLDSVIAALTVLSKEKKTDRKSSHSSRDYWFRALTRYEKRVDFKAIQGVFDKDTLTVDGQIRAELRKTRDSLLKKIETADNAAQITSEFIAGLKLDTNQEVARLLSDYLVGVWRDGRDLAFKELPGIVKKKVESVKQFEKMIAYQTGLEPIDALNYFRTRALILAGVIDDDLLKQAKFELLEHVKGGRPLIETIGNLRSVFEPWVGDPTKIGPSGQIGIGFPPGTMAPENILMAFRLENVVRTETATAMNFGRQSIAEAAGDYVLGYEYSAILDERTCVAGNTQILMADRTRRTIDAIRPGQYIISGTGKRRKVLAAWRYPATRWHRIKINGEREISCTATHRFWTSNDGVNYGWIEARNINPGDIIADQKEKWFNAKALDLPTVWQYKVPSRTSEPEVLFQTMLERTPGEQPEDTNVSDLRSRVGNVWSRAQQKEILFAQVLSSNKRGASKNQLCSLRRSDCQISARCASAVLQHAMRSCQCQTRESHQSLRVLREPLRETSTPCVSIEILLSKLPQCFLWTRSISDCYGSDELCGMSEAYHSCDAVYATNQEEILQHCMLEQVATQSQHDDFVSYVRQGIQDDSISTEYVLQHEVFPPEGESHEDGDHGRRYLEGIGYKLYSSVANDKKKDGGFYAARLQDDLGNGRRVLAQEEPGLRSKARCAGNVDGIQSDSFPLFICDAGERRFTAKYADHDVKPNGHENAVVVSNEITERVDWAYDLEVEGDHCYVANGIVSHNTEVCKTADGLVFPKNSANSVKLTPPAHYQCRSILAFVTLDDAPVEWSSQAEIDKVVRLISPDFK